MAPDKKTPRNVVPISSSSMRAGFCSSPTCGAPGHLTKGQTPCLVPNDAGWRCTCAVGPGISLASTSGPSFSICSGTCVAPWICSGIADRSIGAERSAAFLAAHPRLHVHYFPVYAPELNPAEYVWARTDRALANGAPDDLAELRHRLDSTVPRLRRSQHSSGPASTPPISRGVDNLSIIYVEVK
jgi:hypothetical protein